MPVHHVSLVRNPDVVALGEECLWLFTLAVADSKILQVDRRRRWRSMCLLSCRFLLLAQQRRYFYRSEYRPAPLRRERCSFPCPRTSPLRSSPADPDAAAGPATRATRLQHLSSFRRCRYRGRLRLRRRHPTSGSKPRSGSRQSPARSRCAVLVLLSAPAFMPRSSGRWTGEPKPSRCRPAFLQTTPRRSAASSSAVPPR